MFTSNFRVDKKLHCIVLEKVNINLRRRDIHNNKTSSHVTHMSFSIKNHNFKNTFVQIYKFINHFRLCTILSESHFPQFFLGRIALFHFIFSIYTLFPYTQLQTREGPYFRVPTSAIGPPNKPIFTAPFT